MAIYNTGVFYGSGQRYVGASSTAAQAIPLDLRFYRTSQDGVYVFWWGFDPAFITPSLRYADFDLELDTTLLFNSPNLVTYTSTTAITFQNGNVRKGFAVPVAPRANGVVQVWYARVRTHSVSITSDWSAAIEWTIPVSVQQSTAEALMNSLPDFHVYGKGDLLKPLDQRNTNLWQVEYMYGNQLDQVYYATFLTGTNNYVDLAVDEVLYQNFGVMFNFSKPNDMQYVDYRWILINMYLGSLAGSTVQAVNLVGQAFTGVYPIITNIRALNDFFLNLIQQGTPNSGVGAPVFNSPYTQPADGVRTQFTFEYHFVASSVQVFKNGARLNPGVDFSEDDAVPGVNMTIAPMATDVLVFFYQIGLPSDPRPILFDPTVTTSLPGTITYTNESLDVTGVGTNFLSLTAGDILVDGNGYYATIASITSNTALVLVDAWGGATETVAAMRATYNIQPIVLWDAGTLAFGVVIIILNPGDFDLNLSQIESLMNQLLPASTKVFYQIAI
jgi:hypothetical protein